MSAVVEAVALKLHTEHVRRHGTTKPTSRTIVRVVIGLLADAFDEGGDGITAECLRAALSDGQKGG